MIKTANELVAACLDAANNHKTLYVMGCFGAPMNDSNKARLIEHHSYNQRSDRIPMIQAATADTFGFDCICFVKGLLWGWNGNASKTDGGAVYAVNGVPDLDTEQMLAVCKDVSTDFSKIQPGEFLWMQGHCGIYIGNGQAVECTPAWENGVQVTTVRNIKSGAGHMWMKHGKLPYIEYPAEAEKAPAAEKTPEKDMSIDQAIDVLAKAVIAGQFGNGAERKERLYRAVQDRVNKMFGA